MENEIMEAIEMTDEQTEKVSGGVSTDMVCSNCKFSATWGGNYYQQSAKCPKCGENTFIGVRFIGGGFIRA